MVDEQLVVALFVVMMVSEFAPKTKVTDSGVDEPEEVIFILLPFIT